MKSSPENVLHYIYERIGGRDSYLKVGNKTCLLSGIKKVPSICIGQSAIAIYFINQLKE